METIRAAFMMPKHAWFYGKLPETPKPKKGELWIVSSKKIESPSHTTTLKVKALAQASLEDKK